MASVSDAGSFDVSLGCLYSSSLDELAAQLSSVAGLHDTEREVVLEATRESLAGVLHAKLCRLLITELHAARAGGRLDGVSPQERWTCFLARSAEPGFWRAIEPHYPTMRARVSRIVANRCAASARFARHLANDRARLATLGFGARLAGLGFGAGDSHCAGRTVAIVDGEDGARLVYKPRSLRVDASLKAFVATIAGVAGLATGAYVPDVLEGTDHGWCEFVRHRFAEAHELPLFYRSIGHWLALMRLLGGSDLHAENLIARGAQAVVVDCETLFTPVIPQKPTGLGAAPDAASERLARSVLTVGLLPGRGLGLGWRGIDGSALGMLPGEQPHVPVPTILDAGTDQARIGTALVPLPPALNHPSPAPALAKHWPEVLHGFDEMTAALRALDRSGRLAPMLEPFADCRVRVVVRATEVYAELGRMLWHPISLHDEASARAKARELLTQMAGNVALAPAAAEVIEAEIDELEMGDIPYFSCIAAHGRLDGPGGTHWLAAADRVEEALACWRAGDEALDRKVIRASLVSAYLNDGWTPTEERLRAGPPRTDEHEHRRRGAALAIMRSILDEAIRGEDGTATWIAPSLNPAGWSVQPLDAELYSGISGIAVLTAAYLHEMRAGRAEPLPQLESLLDGCLRTLRNAQRKLLDNMAAHVRMRPPQVGGYIGLGSQIASLLLLERLGAATPEDIERARRLASLVPDVLRHDRHFDVLGGAAGCIVPLLALFERTGDHGLLPIARMLAEHLRNAATFDGDAAYWPTSQWPNGVGGFAHGTTGIGWALTHLARTLGDADALTLADAAFRFEQRLYDADERAWLDMRNDGPDVPPDARYSAAWCHGAVGIGLARLDLDPRLDDPTTEKMLQDAVACTLRRGLGWNHTLCHGDLGAWELLREADRRGLLPPGHTRAALEADILTSIEDHGPCSGFVRDVLSPGLLPGVGGIAYQLLRMHPDSDLPSMLAPGRSSERLV